MRSTVGFAPTCSCAIPPAILGDSQKNIAENQLGNARTQGRPDTPQRTWCIQELLLPSGNLTELHRPAIRLPLSHGVPVVENANPWPVGRYGSYHELLVHRANRGYDQHVRINCAGTKTLAPVDDVSDTTLGRKACTLVERIERIAPEPLIADGFRKKLFGLWP